MAQEIAQMSELEKYNFNQIQNLIEGGLMHDWAISIEYAVRTQQYDIEWVKWDKTLFAIKDPNQVIERLKECCKNNPHCQMKLVCEHFSPECRLVYCIHKLNNDTRQ